MLDLTKKVLPSSIEVDGETYKIKTDFRYWLLFIHYLKDENSVFSDLLYLFVDKIPINLNEAFKQLYLFCFPPRLLPRVEKSEDDNIIVVDYEIDADLIFSAFYQIYKIDLLEKDMHWHKFKVLFDNLQNTKLNDVMSYRTYSKNSKSYDRTMQDLKKIWEIKTEMTLTDAERKQLERFNRLATGKKGKENGQ